MSNLEVVIHKTQQDHLRMYSVLEVLFIFVQLHLAYDDSEQLLNF